MKLAWRLLRRSSRRKYVKNMQISFTDALGHRNFPNLQRMAAPVAGG
jgi:hypothetical protein